MEEADLPDNSEDRKIWVAKFVYVAPDSCSIQEEVSEGNLPLCAEQS